MNFAKFIIVLFVLEFKGHDTTLTNNQMLTDKKPQNTADNNASAISIHLPAIIYLNEVIKVEFYIMNTTLTSQIAVNIHNGYIIDESNLSKNAYHKSYTSTSELHSFWLKAINLLPMELQITVTAGNVSQHVAKTINVQNRQDLTQKVFWTWFEVENGSSYTKEVDFQVPDNIEIVIGKTTYSRNLLLNDYVHKMSTIPMDYIEHKIDQLIIYCLTINFMSTIDIKDIQNSYQEALKFLQSLNEEALKHPLMTLWIQAYAVTAVINCKQHIEIDMQEVERSLDYIESKQNLNGSFIDRPVAYVRREMGSEHAQQFLTTSYITLAFIKYQKYSEKYSNVISKALKFLNDSAADLIDDYEKSVVAYTFAACGDLHTSKFLTSNLKMDFMRSSGQRKDMAMHVETASYLTMLKISHGEDPKAEIDFLFSQRKIDGSFYSSYDTALAMDALIRYTHFKNNSLNLNSSQVDSIIYLQHQFNLTVTDVGLGCARVIYEYFMDSPEDLSQENFSIDVKTSDKSNKTVEVEVDVMLIAEGINRTNLVIIEVEMPRGYKYSGHKNEEYIEMFQLKNEGTLAVFYIDIMYIDVLYKEVIQAVRIYDIKNAKESTVRVYDYYQSNIRDEMIYKVKE